jgi:hypothetical protein
MQRRHNEDQNLPLTIMKFFCSSLRKWHGVSLVLLLLVGPAFSQDGPPPLPPFSTADLNFWPLAKLPWKSQYDDPAMAFTNLNVAPSWYYEGTALSIDTNVPAFLELPVFEEGWTNITLNAGSIEIWCEENWTSMADGGSGAGSWATVWDIGSYTHSASTGAWLFAVDPSGSNLVWVAQSGGIYPRINNSTC